MNKRNAKLIYFFLKSLELTNVRELSRVNVLTRLTQCVLVFMAVIEIFAGKFEKTNVTVQMLF